MSRAETVLDLVGYYGQEYRPGLLVDHLDEAEGLGARVYQTLAGATWVAFDDAGAVRVVCGDIVEILTADGSIDGRCGLPTVGGLGACQGHASEREAWLASSEAERIAWERAHER